MVDRSNLGALRFFPQGVDVSKLPESIRRSMSEGDLQALQQAVVRSQVKKMNNGQSSPVMQTMPRWRSPQRLDAGCTARTKSEARVFFKSLYGGTLPIGFELEKY
jgi:hypothetical protein